MKHNRNGFTMIEILIVIVVIGILFAIAGGAYTNIQNDTEATGAARHMEGLRKSMIAANIKEEKGSWWTEDELEACSTGSVTEAPYLEEIEEGCDPFTGLLGDKGNIAYRSSTVKLRYDNDSDAVLGAVVECGDSESGVNLTSDTTVTAPFTDDYLNRIDDVLDRGDGNDCGSFRWDATTKHINFKMSVDESNLQ